MTRHKPPAFLARLEQVDFYAVAQDGCYVYCYLRAQNGEAPAGTPFYVGVGKRGDRATEQNNHRVKLPTDRRLIRVLRSGLSKEEARDWERFYISRFGRLDKGTGVLRNLTPGGDGVTEWTPAMRKALSTKLREVAKKPGAFAKPDHWRKKMSKLLTGRKADSNARQAMSVAQKKRFKEQEVSQATREKISKANSGRRRTAQAKMRYSEAQSSRVAKAAQRWNVPIEIWRQLTREQRNAMTAYHRLYGTPCFEYAQGKGWIDA